jgi:hypothetical protein
VTARQIELAVAQHFNARINLIVPNVSWGFFHGREADLLILTPRNWLTEVEIKTSVADVRNDLKKRHDHWDPKVKQCWFAVPAGVDTADIPEHYGILEVQPQRRHYRNGTVHRIVSVRAPRINPQARKLTDKERLHLLHLGCMRIWTLKQALETERTRAS